jgi:Protein of unknown function (DUF1615)
MKLFGFIFAMLLGGLTAQAQSPELSIAETARLIQKARISTRDPKAWAVDLHDVMGVHSLPATRENICASIAVIDQESNFIANPEVAGLGALAEKALREKMDRIPILGRVVLQFLETTPANNSYMQRIRSARTERDLDLTYRSMIEDASNRSSLSFVVQSGFFNQMIEERNSISTIGSMQVSVKFALEEVKRRRWLPMSLSDNYAIRDELYTRRGGMYYGVSQLLGYDSGYSRKIYRFADYNAGRYASRNAAFQTIIAKLSQTPLVSDGDLLLYDKAQQPLKKISASESALRDIISKNNLAIDDAKLRDDILKEKEGAFLTTPTYKAISNVYARKTGLITPYAIIPSIQLNSPKIKHRMTTQSYAESVERRYIKCMN